MSAAPIKFKYLSDKYPLGYKLYNVEGAGNAQACYLYYFASTKNEDPITFADSIKEKGVYIFANSDQLQKVDKLLNKLGGAKDGISIFWVNLNDNDEINVLASMHAPAPVKNPQQGQQVSWGLSELSLNFANFQISAPNTEKAPTLILNSITQTATLDIADGRTLSMNPIGASQPSLTIDNSTTLTIPFAIEQGTPKPEDTPSDGPQPQPGGTLAFSSKGWIIGDLYAIINGQSDQSDQSDKVWGGAIRYYYKDAVGQLQKLTYPVFGPSGFNGEARADFAVQLDWFHVNYPVQTFFQPTTPSQAPTIFKWEQMNALSTTGDAILLEAQGNIGFYLTTIDQVAKSYYLSPYGSFTLVLPSEGSTKLMTGLSALEYVQIGAGYTLQLVPNQPAFSAAFSGSAMEGATALLDNTYVTSWLRINPPANSQYPYFSQPAAMSFYGASPGGSNYNLADILDVKIGDFPFPATQASPAIPCGLYYNFFTSLTPKPNPTTSAATVQQFEQQIITAARFATLSDSAEPGKGPVLYSGQGTPYTQGNALSSIGFIFGVNEGGNHAGAPSSLTLAKSGTDYLRIKANNQGILDTNLSLALMNNQGFVVINAWDKLQLDNKISISGFTFNVNNVGAGDDSINPIMIFKLGQQSSLIQFIQNTKTWANTGNLLEGDQEAVQVTLLAALAQAQNASSKDSPFQNFLRLAADPAWTGFLVFNCPIDGSQMDPDFQMLFAGIDGPLIAHHIGLETNQTKLAANLFDIDTSSLFGVINYQGQDVKASDEAYAFTVKELIIVFNNSTITAFHATVGLTINTLFGRAVSLQGNGEGIPNTLYIQGQYQTIGGVGRVSFNSDSLFTYEFNADKTLVSVLDKYVVTGASLAPTGNEPLSGGQQIVKSRFILNAQLFFSNPLVAGESDVPDLFGYGAIYQGQPLGLPLTGTAFDIQVTLDAAGQAISGSQQVAIDTSNWLIQENKNAVRADSLVAAMPFKLSSLLQAGTDKSLDSKTLGQVVSVAQFVGNVCTSPHYALKFELPLGTLGALSDAYASIDSFMVMAWGPSDTAPDNDGVSVYIQLPEASGGLLGFNLEGIVKTVFGDANLMQVKLTKPRDQTVYVLLFNNVAISILGIKLPPKVIVDFIIFANPAQGGGSNLAWNLAAGQPKSAAALIKESN